MRVVFMYFVEYMPFFGLGDFGLNGNSFLKMKNIDFDLFNVKVYVFWCFFLCATLKLYIPAAFQHSPVFSQNGETRH